jgi:hypothetical protein
MDRDRPSLSARVRALFGIDLRSLALFRVALGSILLIDLASRARLLTANYADLGAHPRALALAHQTAGTLPSLHLLFGSTFAQGLLFAAAAVAALLLLVGWRTRLATAVSWLLLDSLHARNTLVLDGGDHLLRFLLFWSIFLPLGARASLDARRRAEAPATDAVFSPASAALLLQVAVMFFVTGLLKTGPEWTTDGTAIHYAISRKWWILPFGEWLLAHPPLARWLTPAVRWYELLGPFLLFAPVATAALRLLAIPGFLGLLAGLGLGLQLNLFPWIGAAGLLPFVPALAWYALGGRASWRQLPSGPPALSSAPRRLLAGVVQGAVLVLLLLVLWINAGTVSARLAPPDAVRRVASFLHLEQRWSMYAPSPRLVDVWFRHRGRLQNGVEVDLERATGGAGWKEVEQAWRDYRFLYFLQKLAAPKWDKPLGAYGEWLCRRWNLDRSGGARLDAIAIERVVQPIALPGEPVAEPEIRRLKGIVCPL